jgi:hypothetical protein
MTTNLTMREHELRHLGRQLLDLETRISRYDSPTAKLLRT